MDGGIVMWKKERAKRKLLLKEHHCMLEDFTSLVSRRHKPGKKTGLHGVRKKVTVRRNLS